MKKLIRREPIVIIRLYDYTDDYISIIKSIYNNLDNIYMIDINEYYARKYYKISNYFFEISIKSYNKIFKCNQLQYVNVFNRVSDYDKIFKSRIDHIKTKIKYKKTKLIFHNDRMIDVTPYRTYIYTKNCFLKVKYNEVYKRLWYHFRLYEIYHTIIYIQQLYRRYLFLFDFYSVY